MLMVVSPAKSLDYESKVKTRKHSQPDFLAESQQLVKGLKKLQPDGLAELMNISSSLAEENFQRYLNWHTPFDLKNARQALFAFKGDVYLGLRAEDYSAADLDFAQKHLRILSGLYGLLRPLDLMQPYRLEMGRKFASGKAKDLYEFWGSRLTDKLNTELAAYPEDKRILINLASNEYFNSIQGKELVGQVITPQFKDWSNGQFRVLSFFAKKARGQMVSYIVKNRLKDPARLKDFDVEGYRFDESESTDKKLVFKRKQKP